MSPAQILLIMKKAKLLISTCQPGKRQMPFDQQQSSGENMNLKSLAIGKKRATAGE